MEKYKEKLLNSLKSHIDFIRQRILVSLEKTQILASKSVKEIARMRPEDQIVQMQLKANAENRVVELKNLESSPYFMKCYITDEDGVDKEYFTRQKSEFALPEIIAQIEKAQDQVIRAEHVGPLAISGPAGSGKTTL